MSHSLADPQPASLTVNKYTAYSDADLCVISVWRSSSHALNENRMAFFTGWWDVILNGICLSLLCDTSFIALSVTLVKTLLFTITALTQSLKEQFALTNHLSALMRHKSHHPAMLADVGKKLASKAKTLFVQNELQHISFYSHITCFCKVSGQVLAVKWNSQRTKVSALKRIKKGECAYNCNSQSVKPWVTQIAYTLTYKLFFERNQQGFIKLIKKWQ